MVIPTPILVGVPLLGVAALVWWEWSKSRSPSVSYGGSPTGGPAGGSPTGGPAGSSPAGPANCPAGMYWNGKRCIRQVVFHQLPNTGVESQAPQAITSLTLDARNLNPPTIKSYPGVFNVRAPAVAGNTGGGWINSATSNPASWTALAGLNSRASSAQILLDGSAGTVSVAWYDAASGKTAVTNLTFMP